MKTKIYFYLPLDNYRKIQKTVVYSIQFFFDSKVLLILNRHGEGLMKSIGTKDQG